VLNSAGAVITDTQHIGHKNPFRYRGYYYDTETGLYYLKSRYYDSETCRFINMDSVEYADPSYLHGLNLYAYCNNNPIMYVDPNGNSFFAFLITGLVVGAIAGLCATVYSDYKDDGAVFNGSVSAGAYVGNTLVGGAIGGIIGGTIGALPTIVSGLGSAFAPTVSGGAIAITGEQALMGILGVTLANVLFAAWKPGSWPGDDPTVPPGDDFEWRGKRPIGSDKGAWYNPLTKDSLHPDLNHPAGIDPHWDWINKLLKIAKRIFK
jgi:RHS repeat-associated protein